MRSKIRLIWQPNEKAVSSGQAVFGRVSRTTGLIRQRFHFIAKDPASITAGSNPSFNGTACGSPLTLRSSPTVVVRHAM